MNKLANRKKLIIFALSAVVFMTCFLSVLPRKICAEETSSDIISYALYEANSGRFIMRQNADAQIPADNAARIMICLMALDNYSLTDSIKVTESSKAAGGGYELKAGNAYTVDTLIKSVVLADADNAASALASAVKQAANQTDDMFIESMNTKAKSYGMANTLFSGNSASFSRTTPGDIAILISNALKDSRFKNIYCSPAVLIWDNIIIGNPNQKVITDNENTNITAGGTLFQVGENTVSTLLSEKKGYSENGSVILVINAKSKDAIQNYQEVLINEYYNTYTKRMIAASGDVINTLKIGRDTLDLTVSKDIYCIVPSDEKEFVKSTSFTYQEGYGPEEIKAPITAGTIIGSVQYQLYDGTSASANLIAKNTLTTSISAVNNFVNRMNQYRALAIGLSILIIIELAIIIYKLYWYIVSKKNRK